MLTHIKAMSSTTVTSTSTSEALARSRNRKSIIKTKLVGEIKQCLICEDAVFPLLEISNPNYNTQVDNNGRGNGLLASSGDNKSGKNAELCQKFCKLSLQYLASETPAQELDFDLDSSSLEVCGKCKSQLDSFLKMYNQWLSLRFKLNQSLRDIANLVKAKMKNLTDDQNQGQDQNQRKSRRKQDMREVRSSTTDTKSLLWKSRFLSQVNNIVQKPEPEPPQPETSTTVPKSPIKNSSRPTPSRTPSTSIIISPNSNYTRIITAPKVPRTARVQSSPSSTDGTGRRHRCRICNKAFFTGSDRNRHERAHDPERRFRCQICQRGFDQSSNLVRHMELCHNITRDPLSRRLVDRNDNSYKKCKARRDRINFQRQLRQQNHSKNQTSSNGILHRERDHDHNQNVNSGASNTPIVVVDMNVEIGDVFPVKMEVVDPGYRDHQSDQKTPGAKSNITLPEIDTNLLGFDEDEMDSDLD